MEHDKPTILDILRSRICLVPPGEQLILSEKSLGEEFNLSRTPIRQCLQTLAADGMIEVRPGYGSVTPVLKSEDRAVHMEVFRQLNLAGASLLKDVPLSDEAVLELGALHMFVDRVEAPTQDLYVRLNGRLGAATVMAVKDSIMRTAIRASHWRIMRWRAYDKKQNLEVSWASFAKNLSYLMDSPASKHADALLIAAADSALRYKDPENLRSLGD